MSCAPEDTKSTRHNETAVRPFQRWLLNSLIYKYLSLNYAKLCVRLSDMPLP
jgi:hypothetical protein